VEQINNGILSSGAFNNHFVTVAKNISDNISISTLNIINDSRKQTHYSNHTFERPFSRIHLTIHQQQQKIYSVQTKNSFVYD
jgi:hypothetical protein